MHFTLMIWNLSCNSLSLVLFIQLLQLWLFCLQNLVQHICDYCQTVIQVTLTMLLSVRAVNKAGVSPNSAHSQQLLRAEATACLASCSVSCISARTFWANIHTKQTAGTSVLPPWEAHRDRNGAQTRPEHRGFFMPAHTLSSRVVRMLASTSCSA